MKERICFIDANVLVNGLVELDLAKNKASRELLDRVEQGSVNLITDFLVLAETFYVLEKYKGAATATEMMRKLLTLNALEVVAVDSFTFFEALKRAAKYRLKINDMIHYTIALLKGASGIYSYDKDFNGLEIARIEP